MPPRPRRSCPSATPDSRTGGVEVRPAACVASRRVRPSAAVCRLPRQRRQRGCRKRRIVAGRRRRRASARVERTAGEHLRPSLPGTGTRRSAANQRCRAGSAEVRARAGRPGTQGHHHRAPRDPRWSSRLRGLLDMRPARREANPRRVYLGPPLRQWPEREPESRPACVSGVAIRRRIPPLVLGALGELLVPGKVVAIIARVAEGGST